MAPACAQPAPGAPVAAGAGTVATAPAVPTSPIPSAAVKTNATPTEAEKALVDKFTVDRAAVLGRDDGRARDELINAASSGSVQNPASTPYLASYTTILNREVLPLTNSKDLRVRMNAAIVITKVAAAAQNAWLQPAVEKLLAKDQKDGVVLWGMKAAASILPQPGAKVKDLTDRIVEAMKTHPGSGAIAEEAYSALLVAANPPTKDSIDRLQDSYAARVAVYATGIPDDPTADRKPSVFLTAGGAQGMWTLSNPQQQTRTMTLMRDLLRNAAKQADTAAPGPQREQLLYLITATSTAAQVVGLTVGDNQLQDDAKRLSHNLPANTPAGQVVPTVTPLIDDITRVFKLPK